MANTSRELPSTWTAARCWREFSFENSPIVTRSSVQPVQFRRPARARGQNLLIDRSVARRIVKASRLPINASVLEIGAGTGMLTVELARVARSLIAIEIEHALAQRLKQAVSRYANVRIVRADARRVHLEELMEGEDYHVVSNLPYSVGTPLTIDLLQSDFRPVSLTIMLQLEVAERLCAEPGSMSLLSVIAQSYAEPRFLFVVEPESFRPRPKVRSAVVRLETNTVPRKDVLTKAAIFLARHAFAGRRKKVQNSLAGGLQRPPREIAELCDLAGVDPGARAQELSLDQWRTLGTAALDKGLIGRPAASAAGGEN